MGKPIRATKKKPCRACGGDWPCYVLPFPDGDVAVCYNTSEWNGRRGRRHFDKNQQRECWYYSEHSGTGRSADYRPAAFVDESVPELAPVEVRAEVYAALLEALTLEPIHLAAMLGRGMPESEIRRRGYRTLHSEGRSRLARRMLQRFTLETLLTVPGFVWCTGRDGTEYLTLPKANGMVIPVRDLQGRIVALRVRADTKPGEEKVYFYLSSAPNRKAVAWQKVGPGPGTPCHVPLPRPGGHAPGIVRVTEGEIKASIATLYCPERILTLSVPGVECWRAFLPVLEALQVQTVRVAWDMDQREKPQVAQTLGNLCDNLAAQGKDVELEQWDPAYKGIDEFLVSELQKEVNR